MTNHLKIVEFIQREYQGSKSVFIFMSLVKGLFSALLVYVINQVVLTVSAHEPIEIRMFFLYLAICATILYTYRYTLTQAKIISVRIIRNIRLRLVEKVRRAELRFIEDTGKSRLYARIVEDTDIINYGMPEASGLLDAAFIILFIFIYIGFVSLAGFIFILFLLAVLYSVFFFNYIQLRKKLETAREEEANFYKRLNDTLSGFKEIRINDRKNDALFADTAAVARRTATLKRDGGFKSNLNITLAFVVYIGLLGAVVFATPLFSWAGTGTVVQLVALILFLFGPLNGMAKIFPVVNRMNAAVDSIEKLEASLDAWENSGPAASPEMPGAFNEIEMKAVSFQYTDQKGKTLFALGPIDMTIRSGEIIFLVGGNGSGKSTLLKLLTGLYYPGGNGRILLNGQALHQGNYPGYRELFSIIFTDFHIFKKLYGLSSPDPDRVRALLEQMHLHYKTDYIDGKFTQTDLSTGQRKRLAYIAALLEDKPIYVFDEWAADQDPVFREYFYVRFLNDLRSAGKTVIAATHDDRYFHKADRVLKMEDGQIVNLWEGKGEVK